jgi:hypothetical protein
MKPFENPLATPTAGQAPAPPASTAKMRPAQIDGNQTTAPPKPTRGPLADRSASPGNYNTSGMERAMGALADQLHKPSQRRR